MPFGMQSMVATVAHAQGIMERSMSLLAYYLMTLDLVEYCMLWCEDRGSRSLWGTETDNITHPVLSYLEGDKLRPASQVRHASQLNMAHDG